MPSTRAGPCARSCNSARHFSEGSEVASRTDLVLHRGLLALTSACASLAASNIEEAAGHAREATELLASTACGGFLGRAWDILGRSLAPSDRREATTALQQAATIFDTCGAGWRRDRTLVALRGLGTGGAVSRRRTARER